MHSRVEKLGLALLLAALALLGPAAASGAGAKVNTDEADVAIKGYDPVAYFTLGRPAEGRESISYRWQGAVWRFASEEHRDLFAQSPERYAPQFGGFCAMALTAGTLADIDPTAWTIVDGKLYLNYSSRIHEKFHRDLAGNIKKAEKQWAAAGQ